jgi:8-oxo-dGTP pyrophosphatase MutT (NUDIX family)
MRNATLLFLIKRDSAGEPLEICLAMKKRGFGEGRWNGVGGKVDEGESIEEATTREASEEIGVQVTSLTKVAELDFTFPHNAAWNQTVHTYFATAWEGDPTETEEMRPEWFPVDAIPYAEMWSDDILWLPRVLDGELLKGSFTFAEHDVVQEHSLQSVDGFTVLS